MKPRTVIIVQARMDSRRLPGKILKTVMGRPLLDYQLERLSRVSNADAIVVATTTNRKDQVVVDLCQNLKKQIFRGSETDVLSRYLEAAIENQAENIVRINADCPLIDPTVVETIIEFFHSHLERYDYVSNILEPSYPIGLHTEIFSIAALKKVHKLAQDFSDREHVTPYIYRNQELFRVGSFALDSDLSNFRWTVDYPKDFQFVKRIIEAIYPNNPCFDMYDVIKFLKTNPFQEPNG